MNRHGKIAVAILAIISTVGVAAAVGAYAAKMQEEKRRIEIEKQLALMTSAKEAVEGELKETQSAKAKLEDQVASLKWESQSLTSQLEDEKKAREALTKAVSDKQAQIEQLSQTVEQERGDRTALNEQLTAAKTELAALQQELEQAKQAKASLEDHLAKGGERSVDLQKVVVSKGGESAQATKGGGALAGQVLVVNREFDFVVVNVGKNNGAQVGQMFEIYRDSSVLGKVKVEKVYDALSACAILPDTQKDQLREGDKVRAL